jgi:hypothetical protein
MFVEETVDTFIFNHCVVHQEQIEEEKRGKFNGEKKSFSRSFNAQQSLQRDVEQTKIVVH